MTTLTLPVNAAPVPKQYATVNNHQTRLKLEQFFSQIERRALRIAKLSTSHPEHALDLVQETMLTLVEKYADKPEAELTPLFYRILQTKTTDWYRKNAVRNRWISWFDKKNEDGEDLIQNAVDNKRPTPEESINAIDIGDAIECALNTLPKRQQEAFLYRSWEGLSVTETAYIMKCSEGSVKTHYSRATQKLRELLKGYI